MNEQDTRATAEADQLEAAVREMVDCLIEGARCMPPTARELALRALGECLGGHAEAVLVAISGGG